ncbi:MAG: diguanylate cyclase, partial [Anaerolineae bacterium]|nr:diguanylate cyclase [Anaerolineae bacterium]
LAGKMDGITAAKKIIAKNDIPVIYLTAYADKETLQRAQETSPYGYIVKPFEGLNLRISIEVAIQKHKAEKIKLESEMRFRRLVESSHDGIFLIDERAQIIEWNEAQAKITGISRGDAIGQPIINIIRQLTDPEKMSAKLETLIKHSIKSMLKLGRGEWLEKQQDTVIYTPNGEKRIARLQSFPIKRAGRSFQIGVIVQDVTMQFQAEASLRQSEEQHRLLMEQNPAAVVVHRAGIVLYINPACITMMGAKAASELIGKKILDFVPEQWNDFAQETIANDYIFDNQSLEQKITRLDGSERDILASGAHIQYQGEKAVQSVFLDITERKRIQKALLKTQEHYEKLYTSMTEGQAVHELICDHEGRPFDYKFIDVNPAYEKIIGFKRSDVIGKQGREVYGTETSPYLDIFSKVALSKEAIHFETYFSPLKTAFDITVFSPQKGQFVTLFSDITSRKNTEEANEQYKAQLRTLMMISQKLNETTGFEDTLKIILKQAAKHTRATAGNIIITEPAMPQVFLHQGLSEITITELKSHCPLYTKVDWRECVTQKKHPYQCSLGKEGTHNHCPPLENAGFQTILSIPIKDTDTLLGYLHLYRRDDEPFTDADIDFLETLLQQSISAIKKAYLFEKAQHLSITDALTQLNNRRQLYVLGRYEVERSQRYQTPLSALMIDIDHFKKINDNHGHAAGDKVLEELAQHLRNSTREVDILGRYGGEEFTVLLPDTEKTAALELAERLRRRIDQEFTPTRLNNHPTLTISIGVASLGEDTPTLESLLDKADTALYEAKRAGRNTVRAK